MAQVHLCSISSEDRLESRLKPIASLLKCDHLHFSNIEDFADRISEDQVTTIVLSAVQFENQAEIAGAVQVLKQFQPDSTIVVIVNNRISSETAIFAKKSGASLILSEPVVFETSTIEYLCSQTIRSFLIPIKASQFLADTDCPFSVYALMPLNQKLLAVVQKGARISEAKLQKLKATNELYLKRDDLSAFSKYLELHPDRSAQGLDGRCRIQFLDLARSHYNLVCLLVDESEASSFVKGRELLEESKSLSKKLMANLACVQDPWKIVDNNSQSAVLLTERSTSIAAMAGLMALALSKVSEDLVTTAALLSDIGLLLTPPSALDKLRSGQLELFSESELAIYHNHPLASINFCLSRKLPLEDVLKNIIATTHEQINAKGFPRKLVAGRIPIEAQLIQFAQILDLAAQVQMGESPKPMQQIRNEICRAQILDRQKFDVALLQQIQKLETEN